MGSVSFKRDLLAKHVDIRRRIRKLETEPIGGMPDLANIIAHTQDIVEHLFRGSQQAHSATDYALGHLAAHYWEMEHDDPAIANDWEFHRQMRVLRERVGASQPIVDFMCGDTNINTNGPGQFAAKGKSCSVSDFGHGLSCSASWYPSYVPGKASTYGLRLGEMWQPLFLPGAPASVVNPVWDEYIYTNFPLHPTIVSPGGPNSGDDTLTSQQPSPPDPPNFQGHAWDQAVVFEAISQPVRRGTSTPNSIKGSSLRYGSSALGSAAITVPDGAGGSAVPGVVLPTDYIVCQDGFYENIIECWDYIQQGVPDSIWTGFDIPHPATPFPPGMYNQIKAYGVFSGQWYLLNHGGPGATRGAGEAGPYIPAEYLQSPGPPVDHDGVNPVVGAGAYGTSPDPAGVVSFGGTCPNPATVKTFAQACALFPTVIADPLFDKAAAFWNRHLIDFSDRASAEGAFNHGWVKMPAAALTGWSSTNYATNLQVEYLHRYKWMHWRGRVRINGPQRLRTGGSPDPTAWGIFPAAGVLTPINGQEIRWLARTNIGLVNACLRYNGSNQWWLFFPDYGTNIGPDAPSGLKTVDLEGLSYQVAS